MRKKAFFNKSKKILQQMSKGALFSGKTLSRSIILSFIAGVIISFIIFLISINKIPSPFLDARALSSVTHNLDKSYKYKVLTLPIKPENSPSIIIWGNDKNFNEYCYNQTDKNSQNIKNKPIIKIFKKNDFSLLSLIPFFKQDYKLYTEFSFSLPKNNGLKKFSPEVNDDYWISDIKVDDLDGDGSDEIIVRAYSYICGSGGNLYVFILKDNGNGLTITPGIPEVSIFKNNEAKESNKVTLSDITSIYVNSGKEEKLTYVGTDTYVGFKDLDGDGLKELVMGFMTWPGFSSNDPRFECHLCPHTWYIGVYKYHSGDYIADNNWNHGLLYVTEDKISLGDAIGYPDDIVNNLFGLLGPYYYECADKICDPFHDLARKKSEILKITEEKYANFKSFYN
jgi:hypothetical protein